MLNLKLLLTIAFISVQTIIFAQEICDNGIDDDNDGLVDLNDNDCDCDEVKPLSEVDGFICRDNLRLIMDDDDATSYQWYKDGIAIPGQTESILILMENPSVEGNYEVLVTLPNGCYTSEPHKVEVGLYEVYLGEEVICEGDTIFFGGFALTFSGFFQNNAFAVDGCDSITTLNVIVSTSTFGTINGQICQGEIMEVNNIITDQPGTYSDTIPNSFGCDSIITLNLSEGDFQQRAEFGSLCQGEVFDAYGTTIEEPGTHEVLIDNPLGCDTLITLTLIEVTPPTQELTASVCPDQLYEGFDIGDHEILIENPTGCDTTFLLTVVEDQQPTMNIITSICQGDFYTEYDLNENSSGSYLVTIPASEGCDTLLTIDLTVEDIPNEYIEAFMCNGDVYSEYGLNVTEPGIYEVAVEDEGPCDNMVTIDLSVTNVIELNLTANICEGEEYNNYGIITSTAGPHQNTITGGIGCDSIINLLLQVGVPTESFISAEICGSDVYELYDINETTAGTYQTIIQNTLGCDSTINVELSVVETQTEEVFYSICDGEFLEINNEYYFEEGLYYSQLVSQTGCDSTLTINLEVVEQPTAFRDIYICKGEMFEYAGYEQDREGVYDYVIPNENQCDSLVTIQLFVIEPNEGVELPYYNTVSYGNSIDITPEYMGEGVSNIVWTNTDGEAIGSGPVLEDFMTLTDTQIELIGVDANGCPVEARAVIDVTLEIDIFIPTIFTPDSNDDNRTLQIFGGDTVTGIKEISIFDRWGELVYHAEDTGINENYQGWDGYFRGKKVLPGAYAYIADFNVVNGIIATRTGTVVLAH